MPPIDIDSLDRRLSGRTLVMGVVNVTPDSFSDGGDHAAPAAALAQGVALAADGADIIDIGGESTRPGAIEVDAEIEASRVLPVIRELSPRIAAPISIDTYKASVAEAALAAGARIVNDVWGLTREPSIANVAARHGAAVVIGHWERGASFGPDGIVDALRRFFERQIAVAQKAGIPDRRIVLDPGIGFDKDMAENLAILARLGEIAALGFPVLVGVSRKRFIGTLTGRIPKERLFGTLGADVMAAANGASIVRVHDVAAHREALALADAILASRKGEPR